MNLIDWANTEFSIDFECGERMVESGFRQLRASRPIEETVEAFIKNRLRQQISRAPKEAISPLPRQRSKAGLELGRHLLGRILITFGPVDRLVRGHGAAARHTLFAC